MTEVQYWKFGTTTQKFDTTGNLVTRSDAEIQAAKGLYPDVVLTSLATGGDALRYQVGSELNLTSDQIKQRVTSGRYTVTAGGGIYDNTTKTTLDPDTVGFELQTAIIDKLQDEISQINELLQRLTELDNWINEEKITDDSDQAFNVKVDDHDQSYYKYMSTIYPDKGITFKRSFLQNANNDYLNWVGDAPSARDNDKDSYIEFGTRLISRFGNDYNNQVRVKSTSFTDASERMRNLVKEKSTQAEQLSTDFQSRTSRYNAMMEAMTNYAKTYFSALKGLIS